MAADPGAIDADPPALLRHAFEGTATVLRALGSARYPMADVMGDVSWALQPPRKRRLCAHLHSRAAGGLSRAEARRRARASYREYARMIVDTVWVHAMSLEEVGASAVIEGLDHMEAVRASGRGGILCLVHFGSWDIAASLALGAGFPLSSVMAPVGPAGVTATLAWSRRVKQMELFTPSAAARGLIRALRRGRMIALLVDIPEGGPTTVVDFCNGPVRFSTGPAFLSRATGAPILPADCWRGPDGYRVKVHQPWHVGRDESDQAAMQQVATTLQEAVQRVPEQWYPFNQIYLDEMGPRPAGDAAARVAAG